MKQLFLLISLLISSITFAQDQQNNQEPTTQNLSEVSNKNNMAKERLSSREVRKTKKIAATANFGFDFSEPGAGTTVGFYLSDDLILEVSLFAAQDEDIDNYDNDWEEKETVLAFSIAPKVFVSNSFFVKPGVFYVDYEMSRDYSDDSDTFWSWEKDSAFKRKDIGVQFSLGNQWQWSYFTLGAEWFGIQYGVKNLSMSGEDNRLFTTHDEKNWISFTLAKLNLGVSF